MGALEVTIELYASHPDLLTAQPLCQGWGEMPPRYISDVKAGAARMIGTLPDLVKNAGLRRNALKPGPTGHVLWEYRPSG